jgi:Beta-propeller repeat
VPLSIAVDAAGNAYIAGYTYSADFPITSGALRTSFSGQSKAFVLKLNPSGTSLLYSTFLGGSGNDYATGIAIDSTGQAYISGYTASLDFPVSSNAFQSSYGGGVSDGFFAELNAAGSQLVYATYLGGTGDDTAYAVALDPAANVYLTGQTQSSNFPLLQALQATYGEGDAFVVKLNASSQVLYSTYLGGTGSSTGTGIAADAGGNAYVAGYTIAPDFPVTFGAYQPSNHGSYDAFVAKLSADGSAILSATYFGGSGAESASGIALDSSGDGLSLAPLTR